MAAINSQMVINKLYTELILPTENMEAESPAPTLRKRVITTSRFISSLTSNLGISKSSIYPKNCRYIEQDLQGSTIIVLEDEPQIRTVSVNSNFDAVLTQLKTTGKLKEYGLERFKEEYPEPPYYFNLSFPYIIYIIKLNDMLEHLAMMVFYRTSPLTSLSDYLYICNLPNISNNQKVCLGKAAVADSQNRNLANICNTLLDRFWSNSFNRDYIHNHQLYSEQNIQYVEDFLTWSYYSSKDPMFIYDVKWIPNEDENLSSVIYSLKRGKDDSPNETETETPTNTNRIFRKMVSVFSVAEENVGEAVVSKRELVDDICESILLNSSDGNSVVSLTVGDELNFEGRAQYIFSFMGVSGNFPHLITFEDEEGKLSIVNIEEDEKIRDDFVSQMRARDKIFENIEINGIPIKVGDVIKFRYPFTSNETDSKCYCSKVSRFRKGRDGKIETLLGKYYYLLENVEFENIGSTIQFSNNTFTIGNIYKLAVFPSDTVPAGHIVNAVFASFKWNEEGKLELTYTSEGGHNYTFTEGRDDHYVVMDNDDLPLENPVVRINFACRTSNNSMMNYKIIKDVGCFAKNFKVKKDKTYYNSDIAKQNILRGDSLWEIEVMLDDSTQEVRHIFHLSGNITSIFIPSFDINLEFSIGDDIVIADWANVENMIKIWKITKFNLIEEILYVFAIDDNGNEIKFPFIFFETGKINVGYMRHASRIYNNIPIGTLIKANKSGISNFPKKDVVKISAFITDTGRDVPLILCSNLCTIWGTVDNLGMFDAFSINSPMWKKNILKVAAPDPSSIKYQLEDLCVLHKLDHCTKYGFPVVKSYSNRTYGPVLYCYEDFGIKYTHWSRWNKEELNRVNNNGSRYGILSPRISQALQQDMPRASGFHNFHNWYTKSNNSTVIISDFSFGNYVKEKFGENSLY